MDKKKNYELKSQAVDRLAQAQEGKAPEFSQEELEKYRTKSRLKLSDTAKVLLLKAWFPGAVCYFILMGLGQLVPNLIDMLFVLSVVLGMVTDILTNNVLRFLEKTPGSFDRWMMFPKKGMVSFFANIVYAGVLIVCVYNLYRGINAAASFLLADPERVVLGVEPILFGVFCMGFDVLFVTGKHWIAMGLKGRRKSGK